VELSEVLRRRRMVRSYRADPIPREAVERVVATAVRRAPSGGYSQGQRFVVVTDEATRARLAELAGEAEYVGRGYEPWISRAPVHVVVLAREEDYHERYRQPDKVREGREIEWPVPYWFVDAGAAFMLLLLTAIDEGLAAGTYGVLVEGVQPLKDLLGIPPDLHFVCVVTLGYPAEADPPSERSSRRTRRRKPLEDVVRWERWDG
jgi:FMN reductase [NAD(P)H]